MCTYLANVYLSLFQQPGRPMFRNFVPNNQPPSPPAQIPSRSTMTQQLKKERDHNGFLQKRLSKVTSEYLATHSRHAQCTHEQMVPAVSKRAADLVDAAVLRSTYSFHQQDLESVPVVHLSDRDIPLGTATKVRVTDKSTTYMIGKPFPQGPLYVTSYAGRVTIASTEYKVLSSLKNVRHVPKPVGVILQNFRGYGQCVVTQSWYRPFADSILYTPRNVSSAADFEVRSVPWGQIFTDIAEALLGMHNLGFIHNHLRPASILIGKTTNPDNYRCYARGELTDFSMACHEKYSRILTKEQVACGTAWSTNGGVSYFAPEISSGLQPPSKSSDTYAFGRTVIQLSVNLKFPGALLSIARKCLADKPSDRPEMGRIFRILHNDC